LNSNSELSGAVSEEAISNIAFNLMLTEFTGSAMSSVISCNTYIETHPKPHGRFYITNYHFYQIDRHPGRKGFPHKHADLLVSIAPTGICTAIGYRDVKG
jgi:hypothetical protein